MVIKKGEPWLLWPDKISYGINKGDIGQTFEGDNSFTLSMRIKILTIEDVKRTIFAKVPNYCGIDIEPNNRLLLILRLNRDGIDVSEYLTSATEINDDFNDITYRYDKTLGLIEVSLNGMITIEYHFKDGEKLTKESEPHVIFGAGNFPSNNFNMNLCSYDIDFLIISKSIISDVEIKNIIKSKNQSTNIVGFYDFKKYTDFKVFDLSDNCNFLHKII
jgi:hypothetical protein